MNIDRGFKRIAIAGTVGYWLLAIPYAAVAVWRVYSEGGPPAHPFPDVPIIATAALAIVTLPYLVLAGVFLIIRWVARGFQSGERLGGTGL